MSDFVSQYVPIWSTVTPQQQKMILKQGRLANQPTHMPYQKGCKRGGYDCLNCQVIPCGGIIHCSKCSVRDCKYPPPNCFGKE